MDVIKYECQISLMVKLRLINQQDKKRPSTIPILGLGKGLLGESRALKVGIYARLVQPCILRIV